MSSIDSPFLNASVCLKRIRTPLFNKLVIDIKTLFQQNETWLTSSCVGLINSKRRKTCHRNFSLDSHQKVLIKLCVSTPPPRPLLICCEIFAAYLMSLKSNLAKWPGFHFYA
ncbi:hypothetical protein CEXT_156111 [Caerostris extrusa]|uniref:Uncharacterized protein n=1 Tax=Caerostris extrusa TaxID=172846 RepID=A0AAV4Q8V4_CAEEX|nr:hypothetical protein CEXT_156111 [Caerostris extrusa]